jgi:hypothetical protein
MIVAALAQSADDHSAPQAAGRTRPLTAPGTRRWAPAMIQVPGDSSSTGGDLAPLKGHPHRLGSCATELAAGRLSGLIEASLPQCSEEFRRRSRPKREVPPARATGTSSPPTAPWWFQPGWHRQDPPGHRAGHPCLPGRAPGLPLPAAEQACRLTPARRNPPIAFNRCRGSHCRACHRQPVRAGECPLRPLKPAVKRRSDDLEKLQARPESGAWPGISCGAKGTRTPGLLHAMQALYQLSYSPSRCASTRRQRHASVQDLRRSAVVAEHGLGQCSGVVLDEPPPATTTAED